MDRQWTGNGAIVSRFRSPAAIKDGIELGIIVHFERMRDLVSTPAGKNIFE
jgi:hypothetical protein